MKEAKTLVSNRQGKKKNQRKARMRSQESIKDFEKPKNILQGKSKRQEKDLQPKKNKIRKNEEKNSCQLSLLGIRI
jgi:hypothetical protein